MFNHVRGKEICQLRYGYRDFPTFELIEEVFYRDGYGVFLGRFQVGICHELRWHDCKHIRERYIETDFGYSIGWVFCSKH